MIKPSYFAIFVHIKQKSGLRKCLFCESYARACVYNKYTYLISVLI